ncbi:hypothetical protein LPJ56_003141 [Coemansia sp. RSA 2599]|nr:hypothetical protein LPJ75_002888 [Coemansia sp. RSA 2598]KAJ1822036.1 hypothetical protein LPJ56_003141 [Coemansia sp. RSA 2599]
MKQADQIEYTLMQKRRRMEAEVELTDKNYKKQINRVRFEIRKLRKATTEGSNAAAQSAAQPDSTIDADSEAKIIELSASIADITAKMNAEIKAIEKKHESSLNVVPIFISEEDLAQRRDEIEKSIKEGKVNGVLTKRIKWEPIKFDPLPVHGDFKLDMVADSPYFFS